MCLLRFTDATVMTSCWFRNDTLFTERHKRDLIFHLKQCEERKRNCQVMNDFEHTHQLLDCGMSKSAEPLEGIQEEWL